MSARLEFLFHFSTFCFFFCYNQMRLAINGLIEWSQVRFVIFSNTHFGLKNFTIFFEFIMAVHFFCFLQSWTSGRGRAIVAVNPPSWIALKIVRIIRTWTREKVAVQFQWTVLPSVSNQLWISFWFNYRNQIIGNFNSLFNLITTNLHPYLDFLFVYVFVAVLSECNLYQVRYSNKSERKSLKLR